MTDLHQFIADYTELVYHRRDPEAAGRFIADPCIRHEHGHRVVMTLAENKQRIAGFLVTATNLRFTYNATLAENDLFAAAYEFSFEAEGASRTFSGLEIFRIHDGKITETWNAAAGEGPWG